MSEEHGQTHEEHKPGHHAERHLAQKDGQRAGLIAPVPPVPLPVSPGLLPGDARLNGRGNGPVKVALMRQMQQTHGNRAVQRLLQRSHVIIPAPPALVRPVSVVVTAPLAVQRGDPRMELSSENAEKLIDNPKSIHKRESGKDTGLSFVIQGLNKAVLTTLRQWEGAARNQYFDKDLVYVCERIVATGEEDLERVPNVDEVDESQRLNRVQQAIQSPPDEEPLRHYLGLNDQKGNLQSFASFYIVEASDKEESHLEIDMIGSNPASKVKYAGQELVRQLALLSRNLGHGGRIELTSFKNAVGFYKRIGFQEVVKASEKIEDWFADTQQSGGEKDTATTTQPEDTSNEARKLRLRERAVKELESVGLEMDGVIEKDLEEQYGIIESQPYYSWTDEEAWKNSIAYDLVTAKRKEEEK